MDTAWLPLETAARLEGVAYDTFKKRLQRRGIVLKNDELDGRKKLAPVTALTPEARDQWMKEAVVSTAQRDPRLRGDDKAFHKAPVLHSPDESGRNPAHEGVPDVEASSTPPPSTEILRCAQNDTERQPLLPFVPASVAEAARLQAIAGIPEAHRAYVDQWLTILPQCSDGTWSKYRGTVYGRRTIEKREDFIAALAWLHGTSKSTIYEKLKVMRGIAKQVAARGVEPGERLANTLAETARAILPKPRPGKAGSAFFAEYENIWMYEFLRSAYFNQARRSVRRAYEMLLKEIDTRQRALLKKDYETPSYDQCMRALRKTPLPVDVLARQGEKAFNDHHATYLSRRPPAHSNAVWVTDQQVWDVFLRDFGVRTGRIWMVNFLDVASWKVLGYWFGPVLSSDMVMRAAAMAISKYGVPKAIHHDLGKEFKCNAFSGGYRQMKGEALYREALGLWDRLGVQVVPAIGRCPQSKTIENWHANHTTKWFHELPGWCGANTEEKPEKLAQELAQHQAWTEGKAAQSPFLRVDQGIARYVDWVENDYNAKHRNFGRGMHGMTPDQAFNVKRPADGWRTITPVELDLATADHRYVEVARGGQVNLTFHEQRIEYTAPELFLRQGERVEVVVSRRTFSSVDVFTEQGQAICTARLKPLHDWLPADREDLRMALRVKAAVKRAAKRGIEAGRMLDQARNPAELVEMVQALPAGKSPVAQEFMARSAKGAEPQPDGPDGPGRDPEDPAELKHGYTSSSEYLMARRAGRRGAVQAAPLDPAEYVEEAAAPAKAVPSLHDIGPVTVEEG